MRLNQGRRSRSSPAEPSEIPLACAVLGLALPAVLTHGNRRRSPVMISGGLTAAYNALVPEFERASGHKIVTAYGPSMALQSTPFRCGWSVRACRCLIMVGYALGRARQAGQGRHR